MKVVERFSIVDVIGVGSGLGGVVVCVCSVMWLSPYVNLSVQTNKRGGERE